MSLRYLFIDFDSFFASVEQQFSPELRGKPVGIVPSLNVDTTCCIAASYEAKAHGVKTGTGVREARYLCPNIIFVQGNHTRYVQTHQKIHELIHQVIFVDAVLSIDEMYGRLPPRWQSPEIARSKALEIKTKLADNIGSHISASIGIAPNRFLAKLASKLEKPNGLVLIDFSEIPGALLKMPLSEVTGIGRRIEQRLRTARILNIDDLYRSSRRKLHKVWGSIEGDRMWYALRGIELSPVATQRSTVGHSHIMPPRLRTRAGAHSVLHRMLQKACRRLRAMDLFTSHLEIKVKFGFTLSWRAEADCFSTQDTVMLGEHLNQLWHNHPQQVPNPTKVAITLSRLTYGESHTPSLFLEENQSRRITLQETMDIINKRYGGRTLYYAPAMEAQRSTEAAPMRIAFNHIPDLELEDDIK